VPMSMAFPCCYIWITYVRFTAAWHFLLCVLQMTWYVNFQTPKAIAAGDATCYGNW